MKNTTKVLIIAMVAMLTSCLSTLDITGAWSEKGKTNLSNKKVLVIARVYDKTARIELEDKMAKELKANGIKAEASFTKFPSFKAGKLTEEKKKEVLKYIELEGYEAIVITSLKNIIKDEHTTKTGGYYAGGNYYRSYYDGFYSYYRYDQGIYVPAEYHTTVSKKYMLETAGYNLTLAKNKQLFTVISSKITDPNDLNKITQKYAQEVVDRILKDNTND